MLRIIRITKKETNMDKQELQIDPEVNVNDYEVGVIVARFQVPELHEGQIQLLDFVTKEHKKVVLFLGIGRAEGSPSNALDFINRKMMLQTEYPEMVILPQLDQKSDIVWSKNLDSQISLVFPDKKALLYGSRDSFIPHYFGRHKTVELQPSIQMSGTDIRNEVAKEPINSEDFRKGIIYNAAAQRDKVYPTVDVACYNDSGQLLMAKKPFEDKWRFVGGFVDTTDENWEMAARREFMEEAGGSSIHNLKYVVSHRVKDWRYRSEGSGIMTSLFLGKFGHGRAVGSDDIEEVKWFDVSDFTKLSNIEKHIVGGHQNMLKTLVRKIYEENLVPNLGPFYKEPKKVVDPDVVVRENKFEIK